MKRLILVLLLGAFLKQANAQQKVVNKQLYFPEANAERDIDSLLQIAADSGKQLLIQVGGNWCKWCIALHNFIEENKDVATFLSKNYITYKLNYSKENENKDIMKRFNNPGRFGFPVLLVLSSNGTLLHTQDSGLLEEGESYGKNKLMSFLAGWTVKATSNK